MEMQRRVCVIDLFGVSYEGTLPSIVLMCNQNSLDLFPVAPPHSPAIEAAEDADVRLYPVR